MMCEHLEIEELWLLVEGGVDGARAEEMRSHLQSCSECQRAWEKINGFVELFEAIPPRALVETALQGSRQKLGLESGMPAIPKDMHGQADETADEGSATDTAFLEHLHRKVARRRMTVEGEWADWQFTVQNISPEAQLAIRGPGQPWQIEQQIGAYRVKLELQPLEKKCECEIDIYAAPLSPETSISGLTIDLYRAHGTLLGAVPMIDGHVKLSSRPSGDYHLELHREGNLIGCIELPITDKALEPT